jgi:ArsR family transcriptional regulator, arsenate/arsenite/antimonite-responsive transcriptional repressor
MKTKSRKPYVIETLFRALADRTRLRLVNLMGDDEVCVCFLVEALKLSQPKISRHLAYLRRAGIVGARRQGKWMHYRVSVPSDARAAAIFAAVRSGLKENKEMQVDRTRLIGLCCSSSVSASLKKAPKPASVVSAQAIER